MLSEVPEDHKSGFINIIGHPNVGKSTLMNALVGERMSIITNKPQTTRHRIMGIVSDDDFQMVFSDTPGLIKDPGYKMQERMNAFVHSTVDDADIMMLVADVTEEFDSESPVFKPLQKVKAPLFLVLNKIDLVSAKDQMQRIAEWSEQVKFDEIIPISALRKINVDILMEKLQQYLPKGPVYYPKDQFTDRPERFFISEIIREKILLHYHQEIPYSVEVIVEEFKEDPDPDKKLVRILANIYVSRKSQKGIIIGKGGQSIKKLGIDARKSIEHFIEKRVYLELYVKVKDNWRDDDRTLKYFGYNE